MKKINNTNLTQARTWTLPPPSLLGREQIPSSNEADSTLKSNSSLPNREGGGRVRDLEDGSLLWVPSWEGVLQWCPADLAADRPLRFWRVRKDGKGRMLRYQLAIGMFSYNNQTSRPDSLRNRCKIIFKHKGRYITLYTSVLTILCRDGFAIADRRHWVVDHINGNTLDDRPSNLQVISQRENVNRSKFYRMNNAIGNESRTRVSLYLREKIDEQRRRLILTMPEASKMDVEMELSLWFNERKEKMYEEAIREVTGRKP